MVWGRFFLEAAKSKPLFRYKRHIRPKTPIFFTFLTVKLPVLA